MFIPNLDFFISDPDPGVQNALDPRSATLLWIRTGRSIFLSEKNERPLHIPNLIMDFLHIYDVSAI